MCTASDPSGNAASCSFTYSVVDDQPPILIMPADEVLHATSPAGAPITYTITARDNCAFGSLTCTDLEGTPIAVSNTMECPVGETVMLVHGRGRGRSVHQWPLHHYRAQ